jgi:hypothetical protein
VESLSARPGRLEVQHRLHRERLDAAEHRRQRLRQARLQQPCKRHRVPAVHVDHARIAPERVVGARVDPNDVARVCADAAKAHEVIPVERGFGGVEQTAADEVAALVELPPLPLSDQAHSLADVATGTARPGAPTSEQRGS